MTNMVRKIHWFGRFHTMIRYKKINNELYLVALLRVRANEITVTSLTTCPTCDLPMVLITLVARGTVHIGEAGTLACRCVTESSGFVCSQNATNTL